MQARAVQCPTCHSSIPVPLESAASVHIRTVQPPLMYAVRSVPAPVATHTVQPAPIHFAAVQRAPPSQMPQYEQNWRSAFPTKLVQVLCVVQLLFSVLVIILEVASLVLSTTYRVTGVGLWCGILFIVAIGVTCKAVFAKGSSRVWTTRALLMQIALLIFSFILIGITGNYVTNFSTYSLGYTTESSFDSKYRMVQAQLAFGVLLMITGWVYTGIYLYVTYVALWRPFNTLDTDHLFRE